MQYLLDANVIIRMNDFNFKKLNKHVLEILTNIEIPVFVSVLSVWEISIKSQIGKLNNAQSIIDITSQEFKIVSVLPKHINEYQKLPFFLEHRDPFDRMLIAQALSENLTLISSDRKLGLYPIQILNPD
jgi:PIN domain nuclease of toxin-antitoxin system